MYSQALQNVQWLSFGGVLRGALSGRVSLPFSLADFMANFVSSEIGASIALYVGSAARDFRTSLSLQEGSLSDLGQDHVSQNLTL